MEQAFSVVVVAETEFGIEVRVLPANVNGGRLIRGKAIGTVNLPRKTVTAAVKAAVDAGIGHLKKSGIPAKWHDVKQKG